MLISVEFFKITKQESVELEIRAELEIHAGHKIFEGHFPGQPVVPGVCMMQMIKEIIETATGKTMNLIWAQEMKFLTMIDPRENKNIQAEIKYIIEENGNMKVTAKLYKEAITFFKFKGEFIIQS